MDTSSVRIQGLDKFYTKPCVAKRCIDAIDWTKWDLVVEPSAGNGSFFKQIPVTEKIGLDIKPDDDSIVAQDFFDYRPPSEKSNVLVIGNPPFGKVSSSAVKFFNHAAQWSNCIAFIIPKTFRRISIQNKLNLNFHLTLDEDIPMKPCSFEPPMSVKCCFQIWERRDVPRNVIKLPTTHNDWTFLPLGPIGVDRQPTPPSGADFALRAYGGNCGDIERNNLNELRPKSWHWIKSNIDVDTLIERFSSLDYSISKDTARQNSIGRSELVSLYSQSLLHNGEP